MAPLIAIVGQGRLGTALFNALHAAGVEPIGPLGRGGFAGEADVVFLCVPDSQIAAAAAAVPRGALLAHCSGALSLSVLGDRDGFSMHPLLSVTKETTTFQGAGCAVSAASERSRAMCDEIVKTLGLRSFAVPDELRPLYHAAAAVAAGNVVAVASLAERLMTLAGVDREYLIPLVRSAVDNWARSGPDALTGPIARGDEATVEKHRAAIAAHASDAAPIWETLAEATRALAARRSSAS